MHRYFALLVCALALAYPVSASATSLSSWAVICATELINARFQREARIDSLKQRALRLDRPHLLPWLWEIREEVVSRGQRRMRRQASEASWYLSRSFFLLLPSVEAKSLEDYFLRGGEELPSRRARFRAAGLWSSLRRQNLSGDWLFYLRHLNQADRSYLAQALFPRLGRRIEQPLVAEPYRFERVLWKLLQAAEASREGYSSGALLEELRTLQSSAARTRGRGGFSRELLRSWSERYVPAKEGGTR